MRVLLVQPPYNTIKKIDLVVEMPLGLCYIAAVLKERGHTVKILDCLAEGYSIKETNGSMTTYGLPDSRIVQRIRAFMPEVVGCSAMFSAQYENTKRLCNIVKRIDSRIVTVVGGMHATVKPEEVLAEETIDFILEGEADYTFSELIDALKNDRDYSKIDGIGYKDNNGIHIKKKEKFIENLDELPFPARDLLNIDNYFKAGLAHGLVLRHKRNMNLITSRGCPAHCIFCTIHLTMGRRFRARSPENVISELEHLKDSYNIKHIQFEDDNLTYNIDRAKKIFRSMSKRKLNLKWNTPNGVALWRLDRETLDLMKESGCYHVKFAVESGNQRVLNKVIKKPQNLKKAISLIKYARSIGLKVGSFFVIGLPGETKEEIQDTFDFPYKSNLDYMVYETAIPQYGTELRKICEEKGYLREHTDRDLKVARGLIETPEFSPEWLEGKINQEYKRYIKYIILHRPYSILTHGWEMFRVFRRNPSFIIDYARKIFGLGAKDIFGEK